MEKPENRIEVIFRLLCIVWKCAADLSLRSKEVLNGILLFKQGTAALVFRL